MLHHQLRIFSLYPLGPTNLGYTVSNGNGIGTLTSLPSYNLTPNVTNIHKDGFNGVSTDGPSTVDAHGVWQRYDGAFLGVHSSGLSANTSHIYDTLMKKAGVQPVQ
jgi:hypothetical protein